MAQSKAKSQKVNVMELSAIFVGDSKNYHTYSLQGEGAVGNIYISKGVEEVPKALAVRLIVQGEDEWLALAEAQLEGMRPGGKAWARLNEMVQSIRGATGGRG